MPSGVALPSQFCADKTPETKHRDPIDCGYYYICGVENRVRQRCAPGTFFHEVSKTCEFPENVPTCVEQLYGDANAENSHNLEGLVEYQVTVVGNHSPGQGTDQPVSVDLETRGAAFRSQAREASRNMIETPSKISRFDEAIVHKDGVGSRRGTENGALSTLKPFDKSYQQNEDTEKTPSEIDTKSSQLIHISEHHESQVEFCVGKIQGNYPDSTDCRYFYQCSVSLSRKHECAPGTVFNPKLKFCDHPANVPSCKGTSDVLKTTEKPIEIFTEKNVPIVTSTTTETPPLDSNTMEVQTEKMVIATNKEKQPSKTRRIVINYRQGTDNKAIKEREDKITRHDSSELSTNRRFDLKPTVQKSSKFDMALSSANRKNTNKENQLTRKQSILGTLFEKLRQRSRKTPRTDSSQLQNGLQVLTRRNGGLLHPEIRQFLVPIADSKGRLGWYYPIPMRDKTGKIVVRYLHVPRPFENSARFRSPRQNGNGISSRTKDTP
ncbi:hypothetical protein FSP39_011750 [Pinctada imbricata]|uniref:Chitin-binding type-2 domain-containing protein n=1 Tax=Pinctada imbricata TaxID=66713 RepID=A0AA88XRM4_PINIB|nr:hypothetical protein FSP39_011750 [Pinctada imbricata]